MTTPSACEPFRIASNYAWNNFGLDIGGGAAGAAANQAKICADFQDLADHCVEILRVWMYPDLRSPGINFDANDCVTSVGGTTTADIQAIAQCAANAGIKLQWTIAAHNAFDSDAAQGVTRPKLYPSVLDATCRQMFMDNLVGPVVQTIVSDPNYAATFHSYDLFNEPDWAIQDANAANPSQPWNDYDTDFDQGPLTFAEMYTFLSDMADKVRSTDPNACVTIGTAGMKWASAWEPLVDINSPHQYNWSEAYFPTTSPPSTYGLSKPTFIGEYPPLGYATGNFPGSTGTLPLTQTEWLCQTVEGGYAGAFSWAYTDVAFASNASYDEALVFANDNVKSIVSVRVEPDSFTCGTSTPVTLYPESAKGQPIDVAIGTIQASQGQLSGLVYDSANCRYTGTYTSPSCPSNINASLTATDADGNVGAGVVRVGDTVVLEDCTDGTPVSVLVGSACVSGSVIVDCGGCVCTPDTPILISDVEWDCLPLGGYMTYQIGGCDCGCDDALKQCGPMGWYYKYKPSWVEDETVCLESGILTIGPKKGRLAPKIGLACSICDENECPECP